MMRSDARKRGNPTTETVDEFRDRVIDAMLQFDPSDNYHYPNIERPGYFSAIDRVVALLRGDISHWTDPPKVS